MAKGRFIDTQPTPGNFLKIWQLLHKLDEGHTTMQAAHDESAATIATLQAENATLRAQVQQALVTAGKATGSGTTNSGTGGDGETPPAGGDNHPNYYSTVVDAKAELVALGEDLSGPCGAFKITRKVAQMLAPSEPTSGLLDKPSGNNCTGYATDIICFNDGIIYDILIDGGGANTPDWRFNGTVDPARWRPSF